MVMEGRGSDWAWLALRMIGSDATVDECNAWLASIFVDDEHAPETLVDAKAIQQALTAQRKLGIAVPAKKEMARNAAQKLLQTQVGREAIRDALRSLAKHELSEQFEQEMLSTQS